MADDGDAFSLGGARRERPEDVERETALHGVVAAALHHAVHAAPADNMRSIVNRLILN